MAHISSKFLVFRKYVAASSAPPPERTGEAAPSRADMVLRRMSGTFALSGAMNTPGDNALQPQTRPECTPAQCGAQCAARVCQQWNAVSLARDLTLRACKEPWGAK